jgi:hypothetical protein
MLPELSYPNKSILKSIRKRLSELFFHKDNYDEYRHYRRVNHDQTRSIHIYYDHDCEVARVGLYSLYFFAQTGNYYEKRIMEMTRIKDGLDNHFSLIIESVATDKSREIYNFTGYNDEGVLHNSGACYVDFSEYKNVDIMRQNLIDRGHLKTCELPVRIDFNQTAKIFLENMTDPNPTFNTPILVPAPMGIC